MAYQITQEQYRDEWVVTFQRGMTYLRDCTTQEMMIRGNEAVFPIQGTAGPMVTRGVNGLIPSDTRTDSQVRIPLLEKHHKETQTSFNIFTAHADLREAMQDAGLRTAYREIDDRIIADSFEQATNQYNGGTAITQTFGQVMDALRELQENNVYSGDEICYIHTPASWARLRTFQEFSSFDYVDRKPLMGGMDRPVNWLGATHMVHTGLPGVGTADAKCYVFAKNAVGYALNQGDIRVSIGYDEEDDYSFARQTIYHGSRILQQSGILEVTHDDSVRIS